ncbi:MAG: hypothetical protein JWP46_363 [Modestobacter sp.]|jgi:hypothetical protein|nr:hypothetical protein [Modestobacter sp.]
MADPPEVLLEGETLDGSVLYDLLLQPEATSDLSQVVDGECPSDAGRAFSPAWWRRHQKRGPAPAGPDSRGFT